MLSRLNGWQRIGVVLTGLWLAFMLFQGAVGYANLERGDGPFVEIVKGKEPHCSAPAPESLPDKKTFSFEDAWGCAPGALVEGTPDTHRFMWSALLASALVPALLAWALAYASIAVIRWVAQGFRKAT